MILEGRIFKHGKHWLAEIPVLDAMTQGASRKELLDMVEDLVKSLLDKPGAKVIVVLVRSELKVEIAPASAVLPLILKRQRMKNGLTIREVAQYLGYKNHNAYAAYEMGKSIPSIEKFEELLSGVMQAKKGADPVSIKLAVG